MVSNYKEFAKEIFEEQNKVRVEPQSYIPDLQEMLKYFQGNVLRKPGQKVGLRTNEGPSAVQECIQFLQSSKPLPPFKHSEALEKAALRHAHDIGPQGICEHTGSDGSSMSHRIQHFGDWNGSIGENIDFGENTPREVVLSLLIDDGVSSRGHRHNIMNPKYNFTGIGVQDHKVYKRCVVFDYATTISDKGSKHSVKDDDSSHHHHHHHHHDDGKDHKKLSKEVFEEQNKIRQNPQYLIPYLQERLKYFQGNTLHLPGEIPLRTNEGPGAIQECIEFCKKAQPLDKFEWSDHLAKAAKDHAEDIGELGITGHNGSNGSTMSSRIEKHGKWQGTIGENIDFGSKKGIDVMISLMVDDGVSSRDDDVDDDFFKSKLDDMKHKMNMKGNYKFEDDDDQEYFSKNKHHIQKHEINNDEPDYKSKSVSTKTNTKISGNKKTVTTTTTTTYMQIQQQNYDGSEEIRTETKTQESTM